MRSNGLWCQQKKRLRIVAIEGRVFKFTMGSSFLRYTKVWGTGLKQLSGFGSSRSDVVDEVTSP